MRPFRFYKDKDDHDYLLFDYFIVAVIVALANFQFIWILEKH